jgi:hypothetical protein
MIQRLEALRRDVTTRYHDWFRIGMALATHFGESGRSLYHRISCYYPRYTKKETDEQYTRCLQYNHHRIRINSLFYLLGE